MNDRFSSPVARTLRWAGWYEGRSIAVKIPPELDVFPLAYEVLAEFGGLHVGRTGPGIDCAMSDVEIDPVLGAHLRPVLNPYEKELATRLFPLGEVHLGHGYLVIDELGRTYLFGDGGLEPWASTFSRCLELLLLGKKPDPEDVAWARK